MNNFGRGGAGNDAVQADAQDGGGFNNAIGGGVQLGHRSREPPPGGVMLKRQRAGQGHARDGKDNDNGFHRFRIRFLVDQRNEASILECAAWLRRGVLPSVGDSVTVQPDHFYTEFFKSLLASGAGAGTRQIHEALEVSRRSPFDIFSKDVPLT